MNPPPRAAERRGACICLAHSNKLGADNFSVPLYGVDYLSVPLYGPPIRSANMKHLLTTVIVFCAVSAIATQAVAVPMSQPSDTPHAVTGRECVLWPGTWKFIGSDTLTGAEVTGFVDREWTAVTVPHTWNSWTQLQTYASAWYRSRFTVARGLGDRRTYIVFEGVTTIAEVFVNGQRVGGHRGAYTRFIVDATDALKPGPDNVLAVKVSNDRPSTADCLPSGRSSKSLFHFYGGIYRKVWLLTTNAVHIDPTESASSGVFVLPTKVGPDVAEFGVKTLIRNTSATPRTLTVKNRFLDAQNREVAVIEGNVTVVAQGRGAITLKGALAKPQLWGPGHPSLYRIRTELAEDGGVRDITEERTGFRSFTMDNGNFILNGARTQLRGVCKHQETEAHASAVTDQELIEDWDNLSDLGVNFARLAHYPHARLEYDQADERGILVWCENGHISATPVTENGKQLTREMVLQNFNHPSIALWSAGNEADNLKTVQTTDAYAAVIKAEDTSRPVTYADDGNLTVELAPHLDFVSKNTYPGWYSVGMGVAAIWTLNLPYISETGGGGVISTHTEHDRASHKVDRFEPIEYQQWIAEARLQATCHDQKDQVQMLAWWMFRDVGNLKYKGLNTKGLLTYAGFRKDTYYLFKAFLRPGTPLVHITSQTYFLRPETTTAIKVYANMPTLTLTLNGTRLATQNNGDYKQPNGPTVNNVFYWPVTLQPGKNTIVASDGNGHEDSCVITAPSSDQAAWVKNVQSSNPTNPAYFIDQAVQAEWPFYAEYDGTADNTFHTLPAAVEGACWIATKRLSKSGNETALSFTLSRPATVFVMFTDKGAVPPFPKDFTDTGIRTEWRDNNMNLVPCRLISKKVATGESVKLDAMLLDYVILVKLDPMKN